MQHKHTSLVVDETIYEMVYKEKEGKTEFVYLAPDGQVAYVEKVDSTSGQVFVPYKPDSQFIGNRMVLFPSGVEEYGDEDTLIKDIQIFISKYLEISDFMQGVAPYYVLLTWIFDNFHELPYLRALGDYGSGKSRLLKVIGSICYKPMFTIGATSDASVFRIIDQFKGTLVIDEADIRYSNSDSTLVQILNSGYQKGFPVYRCTDGKGNFDVVPYHVFGPKIIAGRYPFQDIALESRCIVERMRPMTRRDIPSNLSSEFEQEASLLRNKLLLWRLHNYGKRKGNDEFVNSLSVEPRLRQILYPLSAVVSSQLIVDQLKGFVKEYNQELIDDRGLSNESTVVGHILVLLNENPSGEITIKQLVDIYNGEKSGDEKMNPKKMGSIIRKHLNVRTKRKNIGYILDVEHFNREKIALCQKYGIDSEQVNIMNSGGVGFKDELEGLGLV